MKMTMKKEEEEVEECVYCLQREGMTMRSYT